MAPPHFRSEQSKRHWYCKSCVGPKGLPWFNYADATSCTMCKLGKGLCFKEYRAPSSPSLRRPGRSFSAWADSVQVQKLKQELASTQAKLKRLDGKCPAPEETDAPSGSDRDKQRLQVLAELLKTVSGSEDVHPVRAKEAYTKEQGELKAKLAAARPMGQGLRDLGAQISKHQKLQDDQQRGLAGIHEKLAVLQEQEKAPVTPAFEAGKGPIDEPIKGLGQTLSGLGEVLGVLGAERSLAERLKEDLERLKQVAEEARTKQQEEREANAAAEAERQRAEGAAEVPVPMDQDEDAAPSEELIEEMANAGGDKRKIEEILAKHWLFWVLCSIVCTVAKPTGITTLNVSAGGPLVDYLASSSSMCIAAQEHRALPAGLAKAQQDAPAEGFHGVWEAALPGLGAGSKGGVAVLVPRRALITAPPALEGPRPEPGRMVAAHANCGGKRGFAMISVYLRVDEQMSHANLAILFRLYQYLKVLDSVQMPWVVGGDFNMELKQLGTLAWPHSVNGVALAPSAPTCLQSLPGRTIDFFFAAAQLVPRLSTASVEEANTWPHLPATMQLRASAQVLWTRQLEQAKGFTKETKVGCARPPPDWDPFKELVSQAQSAEDLAEVWDQLLLGVEFELQGRHDVVGPYAARFLSQPMAPSFKWAKFEHDERES
ncbi:unnamed protein product [Prorocentrum cordatum]|uniref:Endonuclease/exonuclease/phosphatase domain-containing protein n=1 Tax=Prorocentrum cordatum TaxID=2364126 RepID=A0ABN9PZY3_9DINO|nr:unnamed protein product [Polarella glacialis]